MSERCHALPVLPMSFSECVFRCAGIKQPRVEGMTPQAVRTKIHYEKYKNATRLQPPFPAAVQADGPIKISTLRWSHPKIVSRAQPGEPAAIFWCAWITPRHPIRRSAKLSVQKRSKEGSGEYLVNIGRGRRAAQKRVTGGRWRRIVLGHVLAEQVLELRGRARLWP